MNGFSHVVRSALLAGIVVMAGCAPAAPAPASSAKPTAATQAAAPAATPAATSAAKPAAASGSASTPAATKPAAVTKPTGELTIALASDVECWNPIEGPCGASPRYHDLVMDRLLIFDENMKPAPGLAVSWKTIDDLTWEFKLRQNVTFTNGEPFDAEAVKFMFEAVLNPTGRDAPPSTVGRYRPLERIEVVDPYTVRFRTKEPFPVLANYLAFEPRAVPPKYYAQVGKDEFGRKPIGTGPYKMVEWVKNERFVLEANTAYWGGPPPVERLRFRPIPEESTRLAELLAGSVHIVSNVPADLVAQVERSANAHKVTVPSMRSVYINLRPEDRLTSQPLREAFFYATDIDVIIKEVLGGLADKTGRGNSITRHEFGYDPNIPDWPYDLEKAKAKLKEANYDGREIKLFYPEGELPGIDALAEALQAQWVKAGLNVSINKQEYGLWRTNWAARTIGGDIYLTTGGATAVDSDARLVPEVHCYQPDKGMGRVSFFCNPEIDKLIVAGRSTVDPAKRQEAYSKAWSMHRDAAHVIALYAPRYVYGVTNKLEWQPGVDEVWSQLLSARWK